MAEFGVLVVLPAIKVAFIRFTGKLILLLQRSTAAGKALPRRRDAAI
jgi:hypothetical protein